MNFNEHYDLRNKHAFLSPSSYSWIRYSEDKLIERWRANKAIELGNKLHEYASMSIDLGERLYGNKTTLAMYVRDGIGFKMKTEQPLYYSKNCFGHCDAISFKNNQLRIHDLKTGSTQASMDQLMVYAALFCLEYRYDPHDIFIELRIYQSNEVSVLNPNPDDVQFIMEKIVSFDKILNSIEE